MAAAPKVLTRSQIGLIWHGSVENQSNARRVGYAIRYIPTRVKPLAGFAARSRFRRA